MWGQYSWLSFLWLLYTPRETALLQKMTNQNSEFSILIQSFRSTEHQNLSSDFSKNITLRENNFRIRTVNSCINLILYNLCTVNVISNDDLTLENICAVEFSKLQFSVVHFNVNYVKLFLLFRKPYIFQLLFLYLSMNMFNHIFTLLSVIIYFHLMKIFIYILYILQSVILYFKNMYNHNFTFYSVIISYFHLINVCICTFNYFTVILHKKIKLEKTALLLDMFSMFANKNEIIYVWDSMRVRKLWKKFWGGVSLV